MSRPDDIDRKKHIRTGRIALGVVFGSAVINMFGFPIFFAGVILGIVVAMFSYNAANGEEMGVDLNDQQEGASYPSESEFDRGYLGIGPLAGLKPGQMD